MSDNIIEKQTPAILSTLQKQRYNVASQHFVKGANNFLVDYIDQIENIIDIKGIAETYRKQFDNRVHQFQEKAQQQNEVQKSGSDILKTIVAISAVTFGTYFIFKSNIEKFCDKYNASVSGLSGILNRTGFNSVNNFLIQQKGINFKYILTKAIYNLVQTSVMPITFLIGMGFDLLLNSEVDCGAGEKENLTFFFFDQVALEIVKSSSAGSIFFDVLSTFGYTINERVKIRPDLHKFLKLGPEAVEQLKRGVSIVNESSQDKSQWEEKESRDWYTLWITKSKKFELISSNTHHDRWVVIKDGEEYHVEEGQDSDTDEMDWNPLQRKMANLLDEQTDKYAAAYADAVRTDILGKAINPYEARFRSQVNAEMSKMMGWEININWESFDSPLRDLVYKGTEPEELLDAAYKILTQSTSDVAKSNSVYSTLLSKHKGFYDFIKSGKNVNLQQFADIYYFYNVVIVFVEQTKHIENLQQQLWEGTHLDTYGESKKSYFQILAEMSENYLPTATLFETITNDMMVGALSYEQYKNRVFGDDGIVKKWSRGEEMFKSFGMYNIQKYFELGKIINYVRHYAANKKAYIQGIIYGINRATQTDGREIHTQITNFNEMYTNGRNMGSSQKRNKIDFVQKTATFDSCKTILINMMNSKKRTKDSYKRRKDLLNLLFDNLANVTNKN